MFEKNRIKYGLQDAHYASVTEDAEGNITCGTPIPIPGAVAISLPASGETVEFSADNRIYHRERTNYGYDGDLEMAIIPDDFKINHLGFYKDKNGVIIEKATGKAKRFALLFQFEGDQHAIRHVLYYCLASRPAVESGTSGKSKDIKTDKMSLSAEPVPNTNVVKAHISADTSKEIYDGWYKKVYETSEIPEE